MGRADVVELIRRREEEVAEFNSGLKKLEQEYQDLKKVMAKKQSG